MVDSTKKIEAFTKRLRTRLIAVIMLAVMCAGTVFAATSVSYTVTVIDDGVESSIVTTRSTPEEVLAQAEITLAATDKADFSEFASGKDSVITIYRTHTVTVTDGEGKVTEVTTAGTVADAVAKAGVVLGENQLLNYSATSILKDGMAIGVLRKANITITADGEEYTKVLTVATVADALEAMGIVLGPDDETEPAYDAHILGDTEIVVHRVTYSERTTNEAVPYETETQKTSTMFTNESVTVREGVNGERTVTYRDKYVDGKLAESTEIASTTITEPVNEIVKVGTKKYYSSIKLTAGKPISGFATPDWIEFDSNGLPTNYKSVIEGKAAAYTGGVSTSTGKKPQPGYIAVDPNQIPYGTEMYIVSLDGKYIYGYCIAADTGGFVQKKTFTCDLYMNALEECYQWGARQVRIYIF